jgi:hypothetical protein
MQKSLLALILLDVILLVLAVLLRNRKRLSGISFSLFLFLFLLLAAEWCYVNFIKTEKAPVSFSPDTLFKKDSLLGYKHGHAGLFHATRTKANSEKIFDAHYRIIEDSSRSGFNFPHRISYRDSSTGKTFVFAGCSFAFGEGLNDEETLPFQFGVLTRRSTVNLGCNGFGVHQVYYLLSEKFSGRENKERVYVYSFLPDHLYRAYGVYEWNRSGPFFESRNDSIVYKGDVSSSRKTSERPWIYHVSARGALSFIRDPLKKMSLSQRIRSIDTSDIDLGLKLIDHLTRSIVSSKGKMVILYWDLNLDKYPPAHIRQIDSFFNVYGKQNPVIRVSSVLKGSEQENFIQGDGHPTALANKKIASALAAKID